VCFLKGGWYLFLIVVRREGGREGGVIKTKCTRAAAGLDGEHPSPSSAQEGREGGLIIP